MVDAETAREATMWVVVVATATLAAARFAAYVQNVRSTTVSVPTAVAWWSTYAIGLGLVVVGLLGQTESSYAGERTSWAALLVGVLVFVLMPADPAAAGVAALPP